MSVLTRVGDARRRKRMTLYDGVYVIYLYSLKGHAKLNIWFNGISRPAANVKTRFLVLALTFSNDPMGKPAGFLRCDAATAAHFKVVVDQHKSKARLKEAHTDTPL
jgi:hypothetical protein